MRAAPPMIGRFEVLLHHRAAMPVPHDLPVGHAVALVDRPPGKVLVRGVAMRAASMMMHAPVVTRLAAPRRVAAPMRVPGPVIIGVVLPRRDGGIVRKRRRQFG